MLIQLLGALAFLALFMVFLNWEWAGRRHAIFMVFCTIFAIESVWVA